ncbi:MAG: hypothetical protein ACRCT1_07585 [Microcoleaceae cyanobacterium]
MDKIGDFVKKPGFSLNPISPNIRNRVSLRGFGQHWGFGKETRFLPQPGFLKSQKPGFSQRVLTKVGFGEETLFLPNPKNPVSPNIRNRVSFRGFAQHWGFGEETLFLPNPLSIACLKA